MRKLTPWFSGNASPARAGFYQRKWSSGVLYALWTGSHWGTSWSAVEFAEKYSHKKESGVQGRLPWRGLSQPPATERKKTP